MCHYPPAINVDDLLRVNFDVKTVITEGLYLIESIDGGKVIWRGCRRISRAPLDGGLSMDQTGSGEWQFVASLDERNIRIAGLVEQVYRLVEA